MEYLMSITISATAETHTNKLTNKDILTIAACSRKGLVADGLAKAPKLRLQMGRLGDSVG